MREPHPWSEVALPGAVTDYHSGIGSAASIKQVAVSRPDRPDDDQDIVVAMDSPELGSISQFPIRTSYISNMLNRVDALQNRFTHEVFFAQDLLGFLYDRFRNTAGNYDDSIPIGEHVISRRDGHSPNLDRLP